MRIPRDGFYGSKLTGESYWLTYKTLHILVFKRYTL